VFPTDQLAVGEQRDLEAKEVRGANANVVDFAMRIGEIGKIQKCVWLRTTGSGRDRRREGPTLGSRTVDKMQRASAVRMLVNNR
jgi:hypothetical protein